MKAALSPAGHKLIRLLYYTIAAYGVLVTAFLLIRSAGERHVLISWFNSAAPLLLAGAGVLMVLCLVLRWLAPAAALLPVLVAFVLHYGVMFVPQTQASLPDDQPRLRLLTFNVMSKMTRPARLAQIIREADADVVALQEVGETAAQDLLAALHDIYPYHSLQTEGNNFTLGMAIFSRLPVLDEEYWQVNRGHQRVTLDFQGQPITIYNTRPVFPFYGLEGFERHRQEVMAILERASQETTPVILMGDFNMSDLSDSYHMIASQYQDVYRAVGWGMGFTFPAATPDLSFVPYRIRRLMTMPVARLDYIFLSSDLLPLEARVWDWSGFSDHRPLYAVIAPA